jgi:hypothetical protein
MIRKSAFDPKRTLNESRAEEPGQQMPGLSYFDFTVLCSLRCQIDGGLGDFRKGRVRLPFFVEGLFK